MSHMAACEAMADADEELAAVIDQALCCDFIWAYRQEDAAAAERDPLDDPDGFRVELRRRLERRLAPRIPCSPHSG